MVETVLLAAGASAGTAATASTVVGALATAGSIVGTLQAGRQTAASNKAQAQQYELSARQEVLKGREQADNIRRSLQSTLASQNAAFAARGISLNGGTPANLATVSRTNASRDIETAQFGAGMASAAQTGQAAQSRIAASAAKTSSYATAAGSLIKAYGA